MSLSELIILLSNGKSTRRTESTTKIYGKADPCYVRSIIR